MPNNSDPFNSKENYSAFPSEENDDYSLSADHYHESDFEEENISHVEAEDKSTSAEKSAEKEEEKTEDKKEEQKAEKKEDKKKEDSNSEHDGKYLVVQKGMACCDKGAKFPNFKVTSHQKHYWNDENGEADFLAVTEDDLTFNPPAMPFGTCSVKNGNPCAFAPSGKWTKTYDKLKIMGKKPLTELSELMCAVGGKITVMKHGQQSQAGKGSVKKADPKEQRTYNPIMDFEEFQEEINGKEGEAW